MGVSATTYDEAVELVTEAGRQRQSAVVSHFAGHAVISVAIETQTCAARSKRSNVQTFKMITPDGQPVGWALNSLYKTGLDDRVYGPEMMMLRVCRRAVRKTSSSTSMAARAR